MAPSAGLVRALVGLLLEHQKADALSDVQMAAKLGVDATHWLRVRRGRHGAGAQIVDGAARSFPGLVTRALAEVGDESADAPEAVAAGV